MTGAGRQRAETEVRAIYEEYTLDTGRVAVISDPQNDLAWIQSDHTVPLEA